MDDTETYDKLYATGGKQQVVINLQISDFIWRAFIRTYESKRQDNLSLSDHQASSVIEGMLLEECDTQLLHDAMREISQERDKNESSSPDSINQVTPNGMD